MPPAAHPRATEVWLCLKAKYLNDDLQLLILCVPIILARKIGQEPEAATVKKEPQLPPKTARKLRRRSIMEEIR